MRAGHTQGRYEGRANMLRLLAGFLGLGKSYDDKGGEIMCDSHINHSRGGEAESGFDRSVCGVV